MKIFEFYFNPKLKPDVVFQSFCYEPENIYEKRVGSLYMVGLLKNTLPQDLIFLDKLSNRIKDRYYTPGLRSPEKSLKESLKSANNFLEDLIQRGNTGWLGNLSFITLSIKQSEFNFSKVGNLKIFLIRNGKIVDIDKKVKGGFEDIEPYPLKVFLNIVSGKLIEDDIFLILSEEIAEFFEKQAILNEIAKEPFLEEKRLIELLNGKIKKAQELSGICLLILSREKTQKSRKTTIVKKEKIRDFSFKKALAPLLNLFLNAFKKIRVPKIPKINLPKIELPKRVKKPIEKSEKQKLRLKKIGKLTIPKISFPKPRISFNIRSYLVPIKEFKKRIKIFVKHKNTILVLSLVSVLFLGSLIFQKQAEKQLKQYQAQISKIEQKIDLAESLLILESPQSFKDAQTLLRQSWEEISPIVKIAPTLSKSFDKQVVFLKEKILKELYQFNKLEEIKQPEVLFEFKIGEFVPQKMISYQENIYFFSPYAKNIFKVSKNNNEGQIIESNQEFNSASLFGDSILFFSKPNKIINFKNDQFNQVFFLETPYPNFDFNDFAIFKSNLYFLDKKAGQIVKYPYLEDLRWDSAQLWLNDQTPKPTQSNSLSIDGSIWTLNKDSISRYSTGIFRETLGSNLFPYAENLSKIFTNATLPYLYILEPAQNRIIIINKSGEVIKQFQSEKFDNLLDFSVSTNGKTIYLLNGLKVYQIIF